MEPIGLYIHVPFCTQKCPYCDFYSLTHTKQMKDYTDCIINRLYTYRNVVGRNADTLYFGGGTPSTLGANRLCSIIDEAKNCFGLEQAEITVEVNPSGQLEDLLDALAQKGVNRISIGMQSALRKSWIYWAEHTQQIRLRWRSKLRIGLELQMYLWI